MAKGKSVVVVAVALAVIVLVYWIWRLINPLSDHNPQFISPPSTEKPKVGEYVTIEAEFLQAGLIYYETDPRGMGTGGSMQVSIGDKKKLQYYMRKEGKCDLRVFYKNYEWKGGRQPVEIYPKEKP